MAEFNELYDRNESRDSSDGSSSRGSLGNISRSSRSEIAGERLYQNAKDTQKKIEEKARERLKVPKRTLNLATRGRRSREPSPTPGAPPRYVQLYESAKAKQTKEIVENQEIKSRDVSPSTNESCERLYSLSALKQQEGKERRHEIKRAKERPPLPDSHFKKIPASEAAKLYDRGMKRIISLEMKRMQAAFDMEEEYVSPLVPKSKD